MRLKQLIIKIQLLTLLLLQSTTLTQANAPFTCAELNNEDFKKNHIITDITQSLGSESNFSTGDQIAGVKNCAKQIKCVQINKKEVADATNNTEKNGHQFKCFEEKYIERTACLSKNTAEDGKTPACRLVQVYVATTGAEFFYIVLSQLYKFGVIFGSSAAVFLLIVGGIIYTTSGASTENTTKAKDTIIRSLSGLIILLLSALILHTINPNFFTLS